jgi:asparagine N-glycosylation enzyme membrane subunit Stt3
MRAGALLVAILALAFGLRALGVERVLPESGDVVFAFGDPYYHLRLALYSLTRFPEFLQFDSYISIIPSDHTYPGLRCTTGG